MSTAPLRLAIVDDHPLILAGFVKSFENWPFGKVVLEAANGLLYERKVAEVGHIHVAVVDLSLPVRNGFETIAWIKRHYPRTRCLAISLSDAPDDVQRALRAGALGYLVKNGRLDELPKAVLQVHNHGFYYNDMVDRQLRGQVDHDLATRQPHKRWDSLTIMQHRVAVLYADPFNGSVAEIGQMLGIAPATVEKHLQAVFEKLNVGSRAELVKMVLLNGLK
jgi:DNA-binding NarL/FixJ family response regulator